MSTTPSTQLLTIRLPLEAGQSVEVLVQVKSITTNPRGQELSLIYCDQEDGHVVRHFPGSCSLPAHYEAREIGNLAEFMNRCQEELQALILAGAAGYGNLTLARAVHLMLEQQLDADDALAKALNIDRAVQSMHARQSTLARSVLI